MYKKKFEKFENLKKSQQITFFLQISEFFEKYFLFAKTNIIFVSQY